MVINIKALKKTTSICPVCMEKIDSDILEEGGKIYMVKTCPSHGKTRSLIEKDAWLYREILNHKPGKRKFFDSLTITLTHDCNNNCFFCYLPKKKEKEKSLQDIKSEIARFGGKYIRLSGGEPALRKELSEIIRFASKNGKTVSLLTNGIKLSSPGYVGKLKDAGLGAVHLSINSLDRKLMKKIEGDNLPAKMAAMDNLKHSKIMTIFSFMAIKNWNEKEIPNIIDFCLMKRNINELRIRSAVHIGRHGNPERIFLSEIIKVLSNAIHIGKKQLLLECVLQEKIKRLIKNHSTILPCSLRITIFINNKKIEFLSEGIDFEVFKKSRSKNLMFLGNILKRRKAITLKLIAKRVLKNKSPRELNVYIRSWPDKYTLDIDNIERCMTAQLTKDNRIVPFCYSLVMNEKYNNI